MTEGGGLSLPLKQRPSKRERRSNTRKEMSMLTRRPFGSPASSHGKRNWWGGGNTPPCVARLGWAVRGEGVEQDVEGANGACCSGGRGMEVRKEQQARVRRKQVALYPLHCGQFSLLSTNGSRRIS